MGDLGQFAMFLALGGGFIGMMFSPVGAALARRIAPRGADEDARVAELEGRVAELEGQAQAVPELLERLEFAERLLAQQRDANALPRGTAHEERVS